jgi:hypothetical protein
LHEAGEHERDAGDGGPARREGDVAALPFRGHVARGEHDEYDGGEVQHGPRPALQAARLR